MYDHVVVFQNPEVTSMTPAVGPKSGGTTLTIKGKKLDTGSSLVVHLGDEICKVA